MNNNIEYVIGVEEFNTNRNSKVIKSNLDQLYRIDPDNRRYTYFNGSCQANNRANFVKDLIKELQQIYDGYNGIDPLSLKVYAIGLPLLSHLTELEHKTRDPSAWLNPISKLSYRILSIQTEVLLKNNFAAILGSGKGLYSKATVIGNESRSKNYVDYLNNHCLDKESSLMYVKENDNDFIEYMAKKGNLTKICVKENIDIGLSDDVKRIANVAINVNHRL